MTKSMLFFIAVLIVALGARPVLAGDEREFLDRTATDISPIGGMLELHDLCKAEFPGTRMCSTSDIVRNGGLIFPGGKSAWVHPSRVIERADGTSYDSASGQETEELGLLSCDGWRPTGVVNTKEGLVIQPNGEWGILTCNETQPVACCGVPLQPLPSSPFDLPGPIIPPDPQD